MLNSDSCFR